MKIVSPNANLYVPCSVFVPKYFEEISLEEFNQKFQDSRLVAEDSPVEYEDQKSLVAWSVSECINLFAVHVDPQTTKVEFNAAFHVTIDNDIDAINEFVSGLNDEKYNLFIYLIGGNKDNEGHQELYDDIKSSLATELEGNAKLVEEKIGLINRSSDSSKRINAALTQDGEVFWCYEKSE